MGLKVPRKTVVNDAVTGLVMAVINVPQALANGVLAGVNPVFGLYSMIVGTTVAAFVTASEHLPKVGEAQGTAVIIRLRDRDETGSTFIRTIRRYCESLQAGGNILILEGLSRDVPDQLIRTGLLDLIGPENVFLGQKQFGASLRQALAAAEDRLAQHQEKEEGPAA